MIKKEIDKNGNTVIKLCHRIDTDNANAVEKEIVEAIGPNPSGNVILDASELTYISSAGLRVLLKLKKNYSSLELVEASSDVYEIFDMTGINSIVPVSRKIRELDVEGLEVIGAGATGKVYRLDDERIAKVFGSRFGLDSVKRELQSAKRIFLAEVPTAIPFEVIKSGDLYGLIYEKLNGPSLARYLETNPDQIAESGRKMGKLAKTFNSMESGDTSGMLSNNWIYLHLLEETKRFLTDEEYDVYKRLLEEIPEGDALLHGDLHPSNIIVQDGEFTLIDLTTVGVGHPIWDMIGFGGVGVIKMIFGDLDKNNPNVINLSREQLRLLWNSFLEGYFDTEDKEFLERVSNQVIPRIILRAYLGRIALNQANPEVLEKNKDLFEAYKDYLLENADKAFAEPIPF